MTTLLCPCGESFDATPGSDIGGPLKLLCPSCTEYFDIGEGRYAPCWILRADTLANLIDLPERDVS